MNQRRWFLDWQVALGREALPSSERTRYRNWIMIIKYLKYCKDNHAVVCESSAGDFGNRADLVPPAETSACRQALAWFFRRAREQPG